MSNPPVENPKPVLIEQTAKKYKAMRAIGILILLATAVLAIASSDYFGVAEGLTTILVAVGAGVGIIVFGVGVILSWWHHG